MIPGWRYDDLRKKLSKDPSEGGIGHKEDGRCETTQRCVIGQKNYDDIVIEHLKESSSLIGEAHGILLLCNQGVHRTNTTGHTLEEAFNEPCWPNWQPVFNCKHFPSSEYYGRDGGRKLIKDAMNWLSGPMVDNWASGHTKRLNERFGFKACSRGTEVNNLKSIQHFLEDGFFQCISAVAEKVWEGDKRDTHEERHHDNRSVTAPKKQAPWRRASGSGGGNDKRRKVNDDEVVVVGNHETDTFPDQDQDQQGIPEWASFEFDPRKWYELLDEREVDQQARRKLFMLASFNDEGKQKAWHLVLKLLHDWRGEWDLHRLVRQWMELLFIARSNYEWRMVRTTLRIF